MKKLVALMIPLPLLAAVFVVRAAGRTAQPGTDRPRTSCPTKKVRRPATPLTSP